MHFACSAIAVKVEVPLEVDVVVVRGDDVGDWYIAIDESIRGSIIC